MSETHGSAGSDIEQDRRRIVNRLRRLEGQVRGLRAMIEAGQECEDVLTQVMAAKSALNQVGMHVIGYAMKSCLVEDSTTERDEIVGTAFDVYLHYRELGQAASRSVRRDELTSTAHVLERLTALEEQVRAVQLSIENDADCEGALRRMTAATETLNEVALAVLGHAMDKCLIDVSSKSRTAVIDEAIQVFLKYSSCVR